MRYLLVQDVSVVSLLEPGNGVLLGGSVGVADGGSASLSLGNSATSTAHDNEEVHTVDTDTGVVLDTQVNVLLDTETEVTGLREVSVAEGVLLNLQASLQDLLGLGATDGDVDGNLFVTSDTEGSDGVTGLGVNGGLTGQLLQHLGGSGQSVTGLTDTDVQHQLLDAQLAHNVLGLGRLGGLVLVLAVRRFRSRLF